MFVQVDEGVELLKGDALPPHSVTHDGRLDLSNDFVVVALECVKSYQLELLR